MSWKTKAMAAAFIVVGAAKLIGVAATSSNAFLAGDMAAGGTAWNVHSTESVDNIEIAMFVSAEEANGTITSSLSFKKMMVDQPATVQEIRDVFDGLEANASYIGYRSSIDEASGTYRQGFVQPTSATPNISGLYVRKYRYVPKLKAVLMVDYEFGIDKAEAFSDAHEAMIERANKRLEAISFKDAENWFVTRHQDFKNRALSKPAA